MSFPNTAPITREEKVWAVVMAFVLFPIGLIAAIGLLAGQGWGRWVGLVLAVITVASGVAATIWLLTAVLPVTSNPFGPWFVFLAGLIAVLGLLAGRAFLGGLRSTETE